MRILEQVLRTFDHKLGELEAAANELARKAIMDGEDATLLQDARDAVVRYQACKDDRDLVEGHKLAPKPAARKRQKRKAKSG